MQVKSIFVPSKFQELYKDQIVNVPTGNTRKNILGFTVEEKRKERSAVHVGTSNCKVDGERLAADVNAAIVKATSEGFNIISVTPVTSGNWAYERGRISTSGETNVSGDTGYSYGYSYTEGVLITLVEGR